MRDGALDLSGPIALGEMLVGERDHERDHPLSRPSARDEIANQVWAAYSNLNTAFRQRQAATALLDAASQSYNSALESYNYGLRNFLDVTAAQRTLAQARSTDVLARTQVLIALADLAFRTGDSIQPASTRP